MNKEIGILTFWGVPNFGAFAQAYALNSLLRERQNEFDVYHIGYLHPEHRKIYFEKKIPKINNWKDCINLHFYLKILDYLKKEKMEYSKFARDWDSIPHLAFNTVSELEEKKWDLIFTGSDAIWEYSIKEFGDDVHLIGNRMNGNKLFSYAASFGEMNIEDAFPAFISQGLMNYDKISVRDEMSYNIVRNLTNIKPSIVLDPSLLWDFSNDRNIPLPKYEKYILVYGDNFGSKIIGEIKEYARTNKLIIIGAGIVPDWCDIKLQNIGPLEWIGMFAKAEFVVTCTFHGLMFSINYNKKVIFNQVPYTINRSSWLLEQIGLESLFKADVTLKEVLNYDWNYNAINNKLSILRKESEKFLNEAIQSE